jgi:hypothetical protein
MIFSKTPIALCAYVDVDPTYGELYFSCTALFEDATMAEGYCLCRHLYSGVTPYTNPDTDPITVDEAFTPFVV